MRVPRLAAWLSRQWWLELGHHDALGPIGADTLFTDEFFAHLLSTPALGGDEALRFFYSDDSFFSERSATKLYLSENSDLYSEEELKNYNAEHGPVRLPEIAVPNTLVSGLNSGSKKLELNAIVFYGAIANPGEVDEYDFFFYNGTYFNVEIISQADDKFVDPIDPMIVLSYVEANGTTTAVLGEDDDMESYDTWVIDYLITQVGTYRLQIFAYDDWDRGDYAGYIHTGNYPLGTGGKGKGKGSGKSGRRRLKKTNGQRLGQGTKGNETRKNAAGLKREKRQ